MRSFFHEWDTPVYKFVAIGSDEVVDADDVIAFCRKEEATSVGTDGHERFWLTFDQAFEEDPSGFHPSFVVVYKEKGLRSEFESSSGSHPRLRRTS